MRASARSCGTLKASVPEVQEPSKADELPGGLWWPTCMVAVASMVVAAYGGCGLSCGLWWLWLMVAAAHGGANFNWAVAEAEWQLRL